jgi:hypothetical protein
MTWRMSARIRRKLGPVRTHQCPLRTPLHTHHRQSAIRGMSKVFPDPAMTLAAVDRLGITQRFSQSTSTAIGGVPPLSANREVRSDHPTTRQLRKSVQCRSPTMRRLSRAASQRSQMGVLFSNKEKPRRRYCCRAALPISRQRRMCGLLSQPCSLGQAGAARIGCREVHQPGL